MTSLVELMLAAEHRRLRRLLASTPLPRAADGRITLTVDVSNRLRPDALTSLELLSAHQPPTTTVPQHHRHETEGSQTRSRQIAVSFKDPPIR